LGELEDRINSVLNDPEQLGEIARLAQTLMGGGQENQSGQTRSASPSVQPAMSGLFEQLGLDGDAISKIGSVLGSSSNSNSQALLEAMKPYLSEKRKTKMDKAMKLARLAKLAGFAMGEMGGKSND